MKKLKTLFAALISSALLIVPQYGIVLPEKYKWYAYGVLFVYEVAARLLPTSKNYSLLGQQIKLIQMLLPNYSTQNENHA